jgi:hypothetical protein
MKPNKGDNITKMQEIGLESERNSQLIKRSYCNERNGSS